jgi:hypothetical protein
MSRRGCVLVMCAAFLLLGFIIGGIVWGGKWSTTE